MSHFAFAVEHTLEAEGVFSDHPDDPGGATKHGITEDLARTHGYTGDMLDLTEEFARHVYKLEFWDALRLDEVTSQHVAAEIFDTAVNMGPHTAVEIAQLACRLMGENNLTVDGALGPKTLAALNTYLPRYESHLYHCLNGYQFSRYVELYESNPAKRRTFIKGWMRRLARFPAMS
jgi:lysozyme family protein